MYNPKYPAKIRKKYGIRNTRSKFLPLNYVKNAPTAVRDNLSTHTPKRAQIRFLCPLRAPSQILNHYTKPHFPPFAHITFKVRNELAFGPLYTPH